tara:strand:+ start:1542 stop:2027 length:486 start_codon:yes stop_codon:yes gene_type:complete
MDLELDFSDEIRAKWSMKRKRKIDCDNPKGFSQKQYCKRQERGGAYKTKADEKRTPEKRKDGTKRPKSEHSDLYTDEDPKGTIKGLGFKDAETAKKSVAIIEKARRPHKHKVQATMAMEQRSRFAAKNAKDPEKKKKLTAANKIYKAYLEKLKKRTKERNK